MLILPIQEHDISLHLLCHLSFTTVLWFLVFRSFVSLGRFIPGYFIFFCCNAEWSYFPNFSLWSFLLVYRNARDFCILILYPATLLNSLISSSNFPVASLGLCMYSIMSSANNESFGYFFLIWIPLVSFYSLIVMARTSKTILNNNGKIGQLGYSWSERKCFQLFTIENNVYYGLQYMAFIMFRYVPFMPIFWRVFIINGY